MAKKKKNYNNKSNKGTNPKNGAVSKKIKILREEGYSQKQAIAIALYMQRTNKI